MLLNMGKIHPLNGRGKWNLNDIDRKLLEKSQATLVFGQMNEPPGARARVALSGLNHCRIFP